MPGRAWAGEMAAQGDGTLIARVLNEQLKKAPDAADAAPEAFQP